MLNDCEFNSCGFNETASYDISKVSITVTTDSTLTITPTTYPMLNITVAVN